MGSVFLAKHDQIQCYIDEVADRVSDNDKSNFSGLRLKRLKLARGPEAHIHKQNQ